MPSIVIKNLKGMNVFNQLNILTRMRMLEAWQIGYAKYVVGIDPFGLGDNQSKLSFPGILQCFKTMSAGTEAAAPNDVTGVITAFAYYPTTTVVSGIQPGDTGSPKLYHRASGIWTRINDGGAGNPTLVTMSGGGGIAAFAGSLWISQNTVVSRQNGAYGAGWTATFGTFTNSGATPRPMKVLGANLFIGNGTVIAKIDTTPAFTASALTLPSDYTVKWLEVYLDRLFISADNGSQTKIFIWNGTDTTYERMIDIFDEANAPALKVNEGILFAVGDKSSVTSISPVYTYNGAIFEKEFMLPFRLSNRSTFGGELLATYRGCLLIPSQEGATTYEDGKAGIFMIGRHNNQEAWSSVIAFNPSNGVTSTQLGGIYASSDTIYIGTVNTGNSNYEVWELAVSDTNTNGIWQSLPIDANNIDRQKNWHTLIVNSDIDTLSGANPTIVIKYRLDYATTWTTLRTLKPNDSPNKSIRIPIARKGRVIEIRFEMTSTAGTLSARLYGFELTYSIV